MQPAEPEETSIKSQHVSTVDPGIAQVDFHNVLANGGEFSVSVLVVHDPQQDSMDQIRARGRSELIRQLEELISLLREESQ